MIVCASYEICRFIFGILIPNSITAFNWGVIVLAADGCLSFITYILLVVSGGRFYIVDPRDDLMKGSAGATR